MSDPKATQGSVLLAWFGGEDTFCVGAIGSQLALQELCGVGIFEVSARLESTIAAGAGGSLGGRAYTQDIREVIRLGLIGGGKAPDQAMALVKLHVESRPLLESAMLAYTILAATLRGVPGEAVGKKAPADRETVKHSSRRRAASSGPRSTA